MTTTPPFSLVWPYFATKTDPNDPRPISSLFVRSAQSKDGRSLHFFSLETGKFKSHNKRTARLRYLDFPANRSGALAGKLQHVMCPLVLLGTGHYLCRGGSGGGGKYFDR